MLSITRHDVTVDMWCRRKYDKLSVHVSHSTTGQVTGSDVIKMAAGLMLARTIDVEVTNLPSTQKHRTL